MIRSRLAPALACALFAALSMTACDTPLPTEADTSPSFHRAPPESDQSPTFLVCPTKSTAAASGIIGPRGGTLRVAGHQLTIPEGAVDRPTRFTLEAPAGRHLKVDITAGSAAHYTFAVPVTVTISYARCQRQNITEAVGPAWYIDSENGTPLEEVGGWADVRRKTFTFSTTHLSTYAVAY